MLCLCVLLVGVTFATSDELCRDVIATAMRMEVSEAQKALEAARAQNLECVARVGDWADHIAAAAPKRGRRDSVGDEGAQIAEPKSKVARKKT